MRHQKPTSRKERIVQEAIRLFAERGVDATTALQVAENANVTEPLVFYYFKTKDGLFAEIIQKIFAEYFSRLEGIKRNRKSEFGNIRKLIDMHLDFVVQMPAESYLVVSACPAKLKDSLHICTKNIQTQRDWLFTFISECIQRGIKKGEFVRVPVDETARLLIAFLNGLIRQEALSIAVLGKTEAADCTGIKKAAINFCRRSLLKKKKRPATEKSKKPQSGE